MTMSYIVSALPATAVSEALVGNFTGPDDINLILSQVNKISVQTVSPEGLKSIVQIPVYGRLVAVKLLRPPGEKTDSIVMLTEKHHIAIVCYRDGKIVTRASGKVGDTVGRESEFGAILDTHPSGLIAIRIYNGVLKLIQWSDDKELTCFNVRFEELLVVDFCFLDTPIEQYCLAYISKDASGRHLKIVNLNIVEKDMRLHSQQNNIENEANMLIPIPAPIGGVVVIGQDTILYKSQDRSAPVVPASSPLLNQTAFTCFGKIDENGERYFLGDENGRLLMLVLDIVERMNGSIVVQDMKLELLGETSIAEAIVYLDNGFAYVGSRFGDSQLIKLLEHPAENGSFVQLHETYTNLGPIRDMIIVECDGQTQLVTCSGAFKEGSLRIVRNGVGIEECASVDLPDINGAFTVRMQSEFDNYLIVSLPEETHVLQMNGEDLEDVELLDILTDRPTMFAGSMFDVKTETILIQIVEKEVRLMGENMKTKIWTLPDGGSISKLAVNKAHGQILLASTNKLYYLKCDRANGELSINLVKEVVMQDEIACVDISNKEDDLLQPAQFAAVALWNSTKMNVLLLPDLNSVMSVGLPSKTLARSIIATCMEEINYLMVALGDGTLLYYVLNIDRATVSEPKKSSVGTRPPTLTRVTTGGNQNIFVCSDRPVIIFSANKKLVLSNANMKIVNVVCNLKSSIYKECLILSDGKTMLFGTVDDIQKMHVRSIPLRESASRIAYQKNTGTYGVTTRREEPFQPEDRIMSASCNALAYSYSHPKEREEVGPDQVVGDNNFVLILDHHTFQVLHAHQLSPNEQALSIISTKLGEDPKPYYIVGTAIVFPDEKESKLGRLIVFEVDSTDKTKLRKVHEKDVKGAPYSMDTLNGKLIVGINSSVRLFEWSYEKELRLECSHFNNISALFVKTKGDQIVVGDLMRSVGLLNYKSMEGTFDEIAKDSRGMWMTGVEFITADHVIGGETSHNLFTCQLDKEKATIEEGRRRLEPTGYYYLGEMVTALRRGNMVAEPSDSIVQYKHPIVYGTTDGTIGVVAQLPDNLVPIFQDIEKAVADAQKNCLRVPHDVYRQFSLKKWNEPCTGFIDGDLVESLLDMDRSRALEILETLPEDEENPLEPTEVMKMIEDLARIH